MKAGMIPDTPRRSAAVVLLVTACLTGCYPDCPAKEEVDVSYDVDSDIIPDAGAILFDSNVQITAVTDRGSQWDIEFSGEDFEGVTRDVTLSLWSTPRIEQIAFEPGEELHVQYVQDEPLWTNTFISFRRDGELLLGLMDQAIIVQSSMWMDPLQLKVKRGFCARRSDTCGAHERAGIKFFNPEGHSELVMDHGTGTLLGTPSYAIILERSTLNYDSLFVPCPNREKGWLRTLVSKIIE
jgi:hypothetical protein